MNGLINNYITTMPFPKEKRNTNGFDKNKQNINRKGCPRDVLVSLTSHIEKTYGKRPPKGEVLSLLEYIECLAVEDLKEF